MIAKLVRNPGESIAKKAVKAVGNVIGDGLALSRRCVREVIHSVNQMDDEVKPNEFEVQLAIKLNSEVGAALTKLGGEAKRQRGTTAVDRSGLAETLPNPGNGLLNLVLEYSTTRGSGATASV